MPEMVLRLAIDGERQILRLVEIHGELRIALGTADDGEPTARADTFRRFTVQPDGGRVMACSVELEVTP